MRRAQGYAVAVGPGGVSERDTITCRHCNTVVFIDPPPAIPKSGFCRLCMGHVCAPCAGKRCTPFERRLERMEARDRLRRAVTGG